MTAFTTFRLREIPPDTATAPVLRAMAVFCLLEIALIHILDFEGKFGSVPWIGASFLLLAAVSMVLAQMLIVGDEPMVWLAAGALALATIIGFVLSRTTGLPGEGGHEIGKWGSTLALSSMFFEIYLVWLAATRLLQRGPR